MPPHDVGPHALATTWDVVVVGAGPAGALAAAQLARAGATVLLLDKQAFPRPKVCGCCLNLNAVSALDAAGAGTLLRELRTTPLAALDLAILGRRATTALPGGHALERSAFDSALAQRAQEAGAVFVASATACGLTNPAQHDATRELRVRIAGREHRVCARMVVVAAGLRGGMLASELTSVQSPTSRIGVGTIISHSSHAVAAGTVQMTCSDDGYVGVVRIDETKLAIAAALERRSITTCGGVMPTIARILRSRSGVALRAQFELELANAKWQGTPALTHRLACVGARRVFAIGDAAGYVEPFTGDGMALALTTATAVVPWVLRALEGWRDEFAQHWHSTYRDVTLPRQRATRAAAWLLRHPRGVAAALRAFELTPSLRHRVSTRIVARFNSATATARHA